MATLHPDSAANGAPYNRSRSYNEEYYRQTQNQFWNQQQMPGRRSFDESQLSRPRPDMLTHNSSRRPSQYVPDRRARDEEVFEEDDEDDYYRDDARSEYRRNPRGERLRRASSGGEYRARSRHSRDSRDDDEDDYFTHRPDERRRSHLDEPRERHYDDSDYEPRSAHDHRPRSRRDNSTNPVNVVWRETHDVWDGVLEGVGKAWFKMGGK